MTKDDDSSPESLDEAKHGIWKSLKNWMPAKKVDDDAITIKSSSDSIASSSNSSLRKWKKLLASPTHYIVRHRESNSLDKKLSTTSSSQCINPTTTASSIDTTSLSDKAPSSSSSSSYHHHHHLPGGILVNAGAGSAQDIAEQNRRRNQRRLYLMRVQQCSSHRHSFSSVGTIDNFNIASSGSVNNNCGRKRQVGFSDAGNYSSSSTLLSTPPDSSPKMMDKLDGDDIATTTELWYPAPRVMFVEPSPVPRFRNEPPAPPPSPPYLNVIVQPFDFTTSTAITAPNENNNDEQQQQHDPVKRHSLIADNDHSEIPTIFTTLPQQFDHHEQQQLSSSSQVLNQYEHRRPRLIFTSPLQRGQTITFSLQNAIPDDHIIIYKFLTSNCKLCPRQLNNNSSSLSASTTSTKETLGLSSSSSSWSTSSIFMSGTPKTLSSSSSSSSSANTERYFVRPSAGKMGVGEAHSDIMLFLNQVPPLAPGEILKDKILVRWAVIQRGTQVEAWTHQLKDSTRRKWLEMLLEKWPDQVVERKTRISIRFV
ncbi:unnamed protein product [Absidia cylindrospora]